MGRRLILLLVVLSIPAAAGAWFYQRWLGQELERARRQPEGHLATFLDDRRTLAGIEWLLPVATVKDAGPYLNPRLRWRESGARPTAPYRHLATAPADRVSVSLDVATKLEGWKSDFLEHAAELSSANIDVSWMHELLAYDYWNVFRNSPMEDAFHRALESPAALETFIFNHAFPDLHEVMNQVKIRWAQAAVKGDVTEALAETRHLARLCISTEDMALTFIAVAILSYEPIVHDFFRKTKGTEPSWQPFDVTTKIRFGRYVKAFPAYFNPLIRPEMLKQVFVAGAPAVGQCTALREGMIRQLFLRPILEPAVSGEVSLRESYEELDRAVTEGAAHCRLDFIRDLWQKPELSRRWLDQAQPRAFSILDNSKRAYPVWFFHVPYVRRIYGFLLAGNDAFGAFERYDRPL